MNMKQSTWRNEERDRHIGIIIDSIKKAHGLKKSVSRLRLINTIMAELRVPSAKAKEYISVIDGKGRIKIDGDEITYIPEPQTNLNEDFNIFK